MEEEKEGETMKDFLYEQANNFFIDHIPIDSIKDLDTGCKTTWIYQRILQLTNPKSLSLFFFFSRYVLFRNRSALYSNNHVHIFYLPEL